MVPPGPLGDEFRNIFAHLAEFGDDAGAPPASARVVATLPVVTVTKDEIAADSSNAECPICLQTQVLGGEATKLPCGHLFCRSCVTQWLQNRCTCPVCRYELETSSEPYERQRRERMRTRKPKYAE